MTSHHSKVVVTSSDGTRHDRAITAARTYGLVYSEHPSTSDTEAAQFIIDIQNNTTCLISVGSKLGPIANDFTSGEIAHRHKFGGGKKQPLARAMGLNKRPVPSLVLDATAGYGKDAFVIASLGCRVLLLERSPVLACLLSLSLEQAATDPQTAAVAENMALINADSTEYLLNFHSGSRQRNGQEADSSGTIPPEPFDIQPDVVYLDPMYPPSTNSAKVKKNMQVLHGLIGPDTDSTALLEAALQVARRRVVVKRPAGSSPLGGPKPSADISSVNTRYDLYPILNP